MSIRSHHSARAHCARAVLFLLLIALAPTSSALRAQTTITRDVVAGGGGTTASGRYSLRGTLSQTAAARVASSTGDRHDIGFWYRAYQPEFVARVSIPHLEAEVGTRVTVPIHLSTTDSRTPFFERSYRARIRFNGTLLRATGATPACVWDEDDCVLDLTGVARADGVLAELEFIVALGNAERTPITIESFEWGLKREDERITTYRDNGELTLLGVCREGDAIRLIRSGSFLSRLRVWPNPATTHGTAEIVSAESGPISVLLVDMLGNTIVTLVDQHAEAQRLYQVSVDLSGISSGSYHLVYITPSQRSSQRLLIMQ